MMADKKKLYPHSSDKKPGDRKLSYEKDPTQTEKDRRYSLEPLYKTTDRYRQVMKPMNVEDFLT